MFRSLAAAVLITATISAPALAAERQPYTQAALAAAQAKGRPILVEVKAGWCPICASQGRTINETTASAAYKILLILSIDFDTQKAAWNALGAQKQSTLIGYRGKHELGRVVYTTDKAQINALLARTIG